MIQFTSVHILQSQTVRTCVWKNWFWKSDRAETTLWGQEETSEGGCKIVSYKKKNKKQRVWDQKERYERIKGRLEMGKDGRR